jgi:outer membrane protein assembly factor BamB
MRQLTPVALAAATALVAGCGETAVRTPPPDPVVVQARDADTGRPVPHALVRGEGAGPVVQRSADGEGQVRLPRGVRRVSATAPGHVAAAAHVPVRRRTAVVRLYRQSLQSPEYGAVPERTRTLPGVRLRPPRGGPVWRRDLGSLLEFPPAVANGVVLAGTNGGLVRALDARTGRTLWSARAAGPIAATPAIVGGIGLVASMDGRLQAFRLSDGRRIWSYRTGGSPIETSPLVVDGVVIIGDWEGRVHAVSLTTRRARWVVRTGAAVKAGAALAGDRVIVADYAGVVRALGLRRGAVHWQRKVGQRFYGGPGVSGDRIVIGDVGGSVYALSARTGAPRWRVPTGGYVYGSPAIADGRVFIGSYDGRMRAISLANGRVVWSFRAGGRISGAASVVGNVVYTSVLARPGEPRYTYGLDVRTGRTRFQVADGRYSPAVAAGRTLYIVGVRTISAYRPGLAPPARG